MLVNKYMEFDVTWKIESDERGYHVKGKITLNLSEIESFNPDNDYTTVRMKSGDSFWLDLPYDKFKSYLIQ